MTKSILFACKWCDLTHNNYELMDKHIRNIHDENTVKEFGRQEVITLG